jgi:hypothetical protein
MFTEIHPSPWIVIPFVTLLTAIAFAPLFFAGWWSRHFAKVSLGLAVFPVAYYMAGLGAHDRVFHATSEYVSFIKRSTNSGVSRGSRI